MKQLLSRSIPIIISFLISQSVIAQEQTNSEELRKAAVIQAGKEKLLSQRIQLLARQKGWELVKKGPNGTIAVLVDIDAQGYPLYYTSENNIVAAATIGTNKLWQGGSTGLNLSGSSANMKDKIGIWDEGQPRNTHVEIAGRIVMKDNATSLSDHSTHVAGTIMGAGVNPLAKGMSYGLQEAFAYDFSNDASEMFGASIANGGLLLSNHSYGTISGWYYNDGSDRWEWHGPAGATEDYKFGYYSTATQIWDSIAYNAPYYLIVAAAGNNRNVNGPAIGQPYWRYDANNNLVDAGTRPADISSNNSYDIIPTNSTAKNILTVGAVSPVPAGYSRPADVVMSSFGSWGPTDDGRIKPDVVADGVNVLSSISTSDNAYAAFSGTSMATPNTSGSLLLLQEHYSKLNSGSFMRAATLKGLVIHTADEAGSAPGPDYQFGWGLVNIAKAANVITGKNTTDLIVENSLANGAVVPLQVVASGNGTLIATLSWTDIKGPVTPTGSALNNTTKRLVNDLDIVIKKGATVYRPWILNPASRNAAATTGDNTIDNVEKIEITDVIPGETYTIEVSHKGTLDRGQQAYSLLVSGIGGQPYCASAPTSSAGAKIDSVSLGTIHNKNIAGCTTYSNFSNIVANIEPGLATPIFVRLASCDATTANRMLKVFVDANNDGDFTDAGETLTTSGVINGNGDYTGSIVLPAALTPGKYAILRIVMEETIVATNISPCGNYTAGETQDYRLFIAAPSKDLGITELLNPAPGACAGGTQLVAVRIHNFGSTAQANVPVTVVIKQGATTVATLNGIYPGTIAGGADVTYMLQTPFTPVAGTTYIFSSSVVIAGDQSPANNQNDATVVIAANSASPAGTAAICATVANLKVTAPTSTDVYTWYNTTTATAPIATGSNASIATILPTYYLGKNEKTLSFGPANKNVFSVGGYNRFSGNFMIFNNSVPLTIESVKLYVGNTNTSGKLSFILGRDFTFNNSTNSFTYIPEATSVIDIYATDPTPAADAQPDDPTDQGAYFYFNLPVVATGEHILIISQGDAENATVYRNNGITTSPYPIGVPGVFTWTGNSASYGSGTLPDDYQKFYYFLYDPKISFQGCPAAARTAIAPSTTVAPTITQSGNVLTSSVSSGNQWYKNLTEAITGAIEQTYTPTTDGIYTVQISSGAGCVLTSNQINFTTTSIPNVDPSEIALTVSPNPAPGQFNLQLETTTRADLGISLMNTSGQRVYQLKIPAFIGRLSRMINPGKLAAGVYYLEIHHNRKMYIKKVVITE